jgi:glycerol-3-phosphate dehydrogenase (NAD(P)+)
MTIGILGAGAFGTSLAIALSEDRIVLWSRSAEHAHAMQTHRENKARLPGVCLPQNIHPTHLVEELADCEILLFATPTQTLPILLKSLPNTFADKVLVACCKGMDLQTGLFPTETLALRFPDTTTAVLTGPSFAADIAKGLPTALTLACKSSEAGQRLQQQLAAPTLRLYRTTDCLGAQLGGALKNVVAIAAGATVGAGLGESARAALITRGFAEMTRFAASRGANPQTLTGLSGFGDLVLTCSSDKSRNFRYGFALGAEQSFDPTVTVEGASTAKAILNQTKPGGLEMPITEMVVALMLGQVTVSEAVSMLLRRPLKEE